MWSMCLNCVEKCENLSFCLLRFATAYRSNADVDNVDNFCRIDGAWASGSALLVDNLRKTFNRVNVSRTYPQKWHKSGVTL